MVKVANNRKHYSSLTLKALIYSTVFISLNAQTVVIFLLISLVSQINGLNYPK